MNNHKLTFDLMANLIGISRAALRITCLKQGNPGKRVVPKLAKILDRTEDEISRMIKENEIKQMYENN